MIHKFIFIKLSLDTKITVRLSSIWFHFFPFETSITIVFVIIFIDSYLFTYYSRKTT